MEHIFEIEHTVNTIDEENITLYVWEDDYGRKGKLRISSVMSVEDLKRLNDMLKDVVDTF